MRGHAAVKYAAAARASRLHASELCGPLLQLPLAQTQHAVLSRGVADVFGRGGRGRACAVERDASGDLGHGAARARH